MTKKLMPAVQAAVVNTLSTYINTQVDAVAAAWADTVPLPHIVSIYNGYREIIPEYPAITVKCVSGIQKMNAATSWADIDHVIDITIIVQSDDETILEQQIQRYMVAIWEVLMQQQNLDGSLSGLSGVSPISYGVTKTYSLDKSRLLMETATWSAIVQMIESV